MLVSAFKCELHAAFLVTVKASKRNLTVHPVELLFLFMIASPAVYLYGSLYSRPVLLSLLTFLFHS